jgi:hypothetical protein
MARRNGGRFENALRTTDSNTSEEWLTEPDSAGQALSRRSVENRRKILLEASFLDQSALMFHVKNRQQPILRIRPSVLAGRTRCPLAPETIINEAGKRAVKATVEAQGFRRDNESTG